MALAAMSVQQVHRERFVSGRRFSELIAELPDRGQGKPGRLRMLRVGAAPRGSWPVYRIGQGEGFMCRHWPPSVASGQHTGPNNSFKPNPLRGSA
jgi:hypothetical protein